MLLNYNNQHKMLKGVAYGWRTAVLHLAPYKLSSRNVCPSASPECIKACLNTAGRGQQNNVQQARLRKTEYFHKNRSGFLWQLSQEIEMLKKRYGHFDDETLRRAVRVFDQIKDESPNCLQIVCKD